MNYFRHLRLRLFEMGLMPTGKVARTAWYLLGLNLLLFALQKLLGLFKLSYGESLTGWVFFLSFGIIVLFAIVAYRWLKKRLLWRLRNRLIVTYVFIGVIPTALLAAMALITIYLFAGQFANFVVISELNSRLRSLEAANAAIANELATRLERSEKATADSLEGLRRHEPSWSHQEICGWQDAKALPVCDRKEGTPFSLPSFLTPRFKAVVRDQGKIYLRDAASRGGLGNRRAKESGRRATDSDSSFDPLCPAVRCFGRLRQGSRGNFAGNGRGTRGDPTAGGVTHWHAPDAHRHGSRGSTLRGHQTHQSW